MAGRWLIKSSSSRSRFWSNLKSLITLVIYVGGHQKNHFGAPMSLFSRNVANDHSPTCLLTGYVWLRETFSCGWRLLLHCYVYTRVKSESLFDHLDPLDHNAATDSMGWFRHRTLLWRLGHVPVAIASGKTYCFWLNFSWHSRASREMSMNKLIRHEAQMHNDLLCVVIK